MIIFLVDFIRSNWLLDLKGLNSRIAVRCVPKYPHLLVNLMLQGAAQRGTK